MSDKDFSLLRPFDLEAAKRGEKVCWHDTRETMESITDADRHIAVGRNKHGDIGVWEIARLRMVPLSWVEGKPVYKGARLWYIGHKGICPGCWATATGRHPFAGVEGISYKKDDGTEGHHANVNSFTWEPPKVKREVKSLAYLDADQLFWLRETAQPKWPAVRVPSEDKVIEVESPAEDGGWITWEGGPCPVHAGTKVDVRLRGGITHTRVAHMLYWHHHGCAEDITAYRPHEESPK